MLSPQLKNQVDALWTMFWASGMTNPLTSIEQITYLLFLKELQRVDEKRVREGKRSIYGPRRRCQLRHRDEDRVGIDQSLPAGADPAEYSGCTGHGTCRWDFIVKEPEHGHLSDYVFPWLRELEQTVAQLGSDNGLRATGDRMADAYFQFLAGKSGTLRSAIQTIDELFPQSAPTDVMGDIFEHLLSEIQTSGKNGQFRTPRHIIRFMVELLNPEVGRAMLDPAAGSAGFLIATIQHLEKGETPEEILVLEWDGTPHRLVGSDRLKDWLKPKYFRGYDNDRTMVRIGWMNMILHGIETPLFFQVDTLGKSLPEAESGEYAYALANPPFTGTIDEDDLHEERFPKRGSRPVTTKSELLFIWLILDLLQVSGEAAVIVPEGVLFGSTGAHEELRRELLLKHDLKGVISLPAGIFEPYTGVKTAILVFQKYGEMPADGQPRTREVWFYEVGADGFSLDKKRAPMPKADNDLWDALEKWRRGRQVGTDYYQPRYIDARWRLVDQDTLRVFPELARNQAAWPLGIAERFPELPGDPDEATATVVAKQRLEIEALYQEAIEAALAEAGDESPIKALRRQFGKVNGALRKARNAFLESGANLPMYGEKALRELLGAVQQQTEEQIRARLAGRLSEGEADDLGKAIRYEMRSDNKERAQGDLFEQQRDEATSQAVDRIVREFAKLDGYDVVLRSQEVERRENGLAQSKSWTVPVRVFVVREDWESEDGRLRGSHDEEGNLRPEYVADPRLYNRDGTVKAREWLDPDCIEANGFNLSAGRYKPFVQVARDLGEPDKIIEQIQAIEAQIQIGLARLLEMVRATK